jgi:hypothetical protein
MRARNIKPSFFKNDILAQCEYSARLVFIGLWTLADREGRLEYRPKKIKAEILPYDDCKILDVLDQLKRHGFIQIYDVEDNTYIQVVNFTKHQHPHVKESASSIPAPDEHQTRPVQERPLTESLLLIPDTPLLNPSSIVPVQAPVAPKKVDSPSDEFLQFWERYPKTNCSRMEALKSYEKSIKRGNTHEELSRGIIEYNKFLAATGSPVAHATTWLNNDRHTVDYQSAIANRHAKPAEHPKQSRIITEGNRVAEMYREQAEREEAAQRKGQAAVNLHDFADDGFAKTIRQD